MRKAFTPSQERVYDSILDDVTKKQRITRGDEKHEEETEYIEYNKENKDGNIVKIVIVIKINGYIQMTYNPKYVVNHPTEKKIQEILNGEFKGWNRVVYSNLELDKFEKDFKKL